MNCVILFPKRVFFALGCLGCCLLASAANVAMAENTPAALKSQITTMISELNATQGAEGSPKSAEQQLQEVTAFIRKYANPFELSAVEEEKGIDQVAREFMATSRASLIKKLNHIKEATPKLSPDRKTYTFTITDPEVSAQPSIIFTYNESADLFQLMN